MNRKTKIILLSICIVVIFAGTYFVVLRSLNDLDSIFWAINVEGAHQRLAECVKVGLTRSQVISALGNTYEAVKSQKELILYQQDKSFVPPPPSMTQTDKEVLLFFCCTSWRVYTYMDANNRVSRIHFSRT